MAAAKKKKAPAFPPPAEGGDKGGYGKGKKAPPFAKKKGKGAAKPNPFAKKKK